MTFDPGADNDEIYVMDADGSNQINLTNNPSQDVGPVWSPDGSRIAFVSFAPGTLDPYIYLMNADGSGQARLGEDVGGLEPA